MPQHDTPKAKELIQFAACSIHNSAESERLVARAAKLISNSWYWCVHQQAVGRRRRHDADCHPRPAHARANHASFFPTTQLFTLRKSPPPREPPREREIIVCSLSLVARFGALVALWGISAKDQSTKRHCFHFLCAPQPSQRQWHQIFMQRKIDQPFSQKL